MFAAMKPYAAAPPPGAQAPGLWGNEEHVRALFGDRVTGFEARRVKLRIDRFPTAEAFRDFFKANYGPTISVFRSTAEEPERVAALDRELVELAGRHDLGGGAMDWEYLLVIAYRT
jgi:hypothetical protein